MAWAKTIVAKDTEGFVSYYADDAVLLAPNAALASGKDAIRAWIKPIFESAGYSGSSGPEKVEVARSGDMAYVWGTYRSTMNPEGRTAVEDHGKYLEVWKKQPDGKWKCIVDMINSDLPAAAR